MVDRLETGQRLVALTHVCGDLQSILDLNSNDFRVDDTKVISHESGAFRPGDNRFQLVEEFLQRQASSFVVVLCKLLHLLQSKLARSPHPYKFLELVALALSFGQCFFQLQCPLAQPIIFAAQVSVAAVGAGDTTFRVH